MIERSTDIGAALRERREGVALRRSQRGFFALPGGMGAARPQAEGGEGDPDRASRLLVLHCDDDDPFVDSSTYGRTISSVGSITTSSTDPKFGAEAMLCDATSECVSVPTTAELRTGTGPCTWWGWFKPTASGTEVFWICKGVNETNGYLMAVGTGGVRFRTEGATDLVYSGSISSSSWTFIKWVLTDEISGVRYKKIFVGDTEVASAPTTADITVGANILIGAPSIIGGAFQYQGGIDEIVISALADLSTTVPTTALPDD